MSTVDLAQWPLYLRIIVKHNFSVFTFDLSTACSSAGGSGRWRTGATGKVSAGHTHQG